MKRIVQILRKLTGRPSCEDVNRFLAEYVEGALSDDVRIKFDKHVKSCKCCGTFLNDYRSTIELAKRSQDVAIPEKLTDSTVAFLRSHMTDA